MLKYGRPKANLRNSLDRDVYQIVKKLEDERTANQPKDRKRAKLTISGVYDIIKKSNSSLARQKRKPLEDAIDRCLDFLKQEQSDSEDSEAALDEINESNKPEDRFLLNRQMAKQWNTTAQGAEGKSTKRRRLSPEPDAVNGTEAVSDGSAVTPGKSSKPNGTAQAEAQLSGTKKAPTPPKYAAEQVDPDSIVLGGVASTVDELDRTIFSRLRRPQGRQRLQGMPVGYIISGPPGTGKQSAVRMLAAISSTPIIPLGKHLEEATKSPEKVTKIITDVFDEATKCAPCIILIEGLHDYMPKSGNTQSDREQEIVTQLRIGMRRLRDWQRENEPVFVVATTTKIETIDASLCTPDLFARTLNIKVPNADAREAIFRVLSCNLGLPESFDYKTLAIRTHGFVGRDIQAVVQAAIERAHDRLIDLEDAHARQSLTWIPRPEPTEEPVDKRDTAGIRFRYEYLAAESLTPAPQVHLTYEDFAHAVSEHTPHMRREGFSTIPSTTWSEVGAMHSVRAAFQVSIVRRIKEPLLFARFGKQRPAGVLLFGPPGCGKTLVAKAVANDAQASFILIKGPELLNKYVGESERAVRELFARAKSCAPCILFFDEMDSLVPKRENTSTEAGARVVNALLAELDGAGDRGEVYVIGTSNRPDMIDPAVLRPGRLDKLLFVDMPTEDERVDILRTIYRNGIGGSDKAADAVMEGTEQGAAAAGGPDVIETVARDPRCKGFSGADLYGLYKNALDACVLRYEGGDPSLSPADWEAALEQTKPSVPNPESYRKLAAKLHHQR
ncbi:hypothetical protein VD0004_g3583 [Verticillium dahliae]|nr:hypothetical protein VD0004_g3583 [Verticillium dahliae]PNH72839.1 hypothetical protein VD0001_g4732 [Verticillium dahliae]